VNGSGTPGSGRRHAAARGVRHVGCRACKGSRRLPLIPWSSTRDCDASKARGCHNGVVCSMTSIMGAGSGHILETLAFKRERDSHTSDICIVVHFPPEIHAVRPVAPETSAKAVPVMARQLSPIIPVDEGDFRRGVVGNDVWAKIKKGQNSFISAQHPLSLQPHQICLCSAAATAYLASTEARPGLRHAPLQVRAAR
jgi:hypothetical protein